MSISFKTIREDYVDIFQDAKGSYQHCWFNSDIDTDGNVEIDIDNSDTIDDIKDEDDN